MREMKMYDYLFLLIIIEKPFLFSLFYICFLESLGWISLCL